MSALNNNSNSNTNNNMNENGDGGKHSVVEERKAVQASAGVESCQ